MINKVRKTWGDYSGKIEKDDFHHTHRPGAANSQCVWKNCAKTFVLQMFYMRWGLINVPAPKMTMSNFFPCENPYDRNISREACEHTSSIVATLHHSAPLLSLRFAECFSCETDTPPFRPFRILLAAPPLRWGGPLISALKTLRLEAGSQFPESDLTSSKGVKPLPKSPSDRPGPG